MSVVAKRLDGLRCHLVWGRPRPRRLCVRWEPSSYPEKRHSPTQLLAHIYCGQTAGWIKMKLSMEINLGPGDVVLAGVAALPKRGKSPQFSVNVYCGQTAKRLDG